MTAIIRFPLSLIAIVLFAGFLAYVLISTGVLNSVQMTLQYGFGSLPEYIGLRVRNGLIPSFWTSQLDAIKTSIAPAVSLFLLSAFLCKRKWILLPLLAALNILVILAGLEYFAKSPLAVYAIQVAITYAAGVATKRVPAGRKLTFLAGFRLFAGVVLSTAILAWMYSFTRFSDNLTDTVVQISRRIFLTPSQSAYTWFYVFPARMDSIGFSQSHILSSIFGVRYSVTGYLPYTVSVLATGNMFGLNANFMATAWAYFGAWGLIVTVQLVVGTIFVERWLQSVSDPYVYWPVYAFVYGSLIIAVTVPFDGAVMFYGVWLVPVLFCLLAKAFASRVHDSRSASQLQAVKALNELVESNAR